VSSWVRRETLRNVEEKKRIEKGRACHSKWKISWGEILPANHVGNRARGKTLQSKVVCSKGHERRIG